MTKYVITISNEGKTLYFEGEQVGLLDPKTGAKIREAQGFFNEDITKAVTWFRKDLALMVASAYEGAKVEAIVEA